MYHKFAIEEKDEWTRSYDNFYKDLEYLYEHNYVSISLNDYLNNNIKVPLGKHQLYLHLMMGQVDNLI